MSSRRGPYIEDICAPVARLADYTVTEDGRVIGRFHEDDEHLDHEDGPRVFEHACKLGLEGIVSKRRTLVLNVDGDFGWSEVAEIDKNRQRSRRCSKPNSRPSRSTPRKRENHPAVFKIASKSARLKSRVFELRWGPRKDRRDPGAFSASNSFQIAQRAARLRSIMRESRTYGSVRGCSRLPAAPGGMGPRDVRTGQTRRR